MAQHILLSAYSTSSSVMDSRAEMIDDIFKWNSVRHFVFLAATFASVNYTFDMFSGLCYLAPVPVYVIFVLLLGIPYMFIEFFIKQYTGKIDFNESLNPILKSINYGILIQSGFWSIVHANDLADAVIYFLQSISHIPGFTVCNKALLLKKNQTCIEAKNLTKLYEMVLNSKTPKEYFIHTSTYYYFKKVYSGTDRSIFTQKLCLLAVIWIVNFFISSLSEQILTKVFKVAYTFRSLYTFIIAMSILMTDYDKILEASRHILLMNTFNIFAYKLAFKQVLLAFGVGVVSVNDFGTMSPFTAVDTCILVFFILFTTQGVLRSLMTKVLLLRLQQCIIIPDKITPQNIIMVLYPLAANLYKAPRLIMTYMYLYQIFSLSPQMAAVTYTSAKMLHTEFSHVKNTYLAGILSFLGFVGTLVSVSFSEKVWSGLHKGSFSTMLFLSWLKILIISYLYGVQRFANDVKFWLGFKPAAYWTICWSLMPVYFLILIIKQQNVAGLLKKLPVTEAKRELSSRLFFGMTMIVVIFVLIKTIGKYVSLSKFFSVFKASHKYGPPDADERKRRKKYNEAVTRRHCVHKCVLLDDRFDCSHRSLFYEGAHGELLSVGSEMSLSGDHSIMRIFESSTLIRKMSTVVDIHQMD